MNKWKSTYGDNNSLKRVVLLQLTITLPNFHSNNVIVDLSNYRINKFTPNGHNNTWTHEHPESTMSKNRQ